MGRVKALLPWQGVSLIQFQITQLLEAGAQEVVVVMGYAAAELYPLVTATSGVRPVVNHDYKLGRAGSVRAGMASLDPAAETVVIIGVDQPRPASLIRHLLCDHRRRQSIITVPTYRGRRGHPVVFARAIFPELATVSEERKGLREVMVRFSNEVAEVEVDDSAATLDLNTPSDYEQGLRLALAH